ncbi:hypothetical protein [Synechococcus elongatus]|uniref:hypothetical protein n=1 Tax=Synechococcus elongatus TaxID=32046 RepID=UPI000F7E7475|nr:hypothetical protein [Synechococcus elongatus]
MSYALAIAQAAQPYSQAMMNRIGDVAMRPSDGRGYNVAAQIGANLVASRRDNEAQIEINRDRNATELEIARGNQGVQRTGQLLSLFDAAAQNLLNYRGQSLQREAVSENNQTQLLNTTIDNALTGLREGQVQSFMNQREALNFMRSMPVPQVQGNQIKIESPPPPNVINVQQPQQNSQYQSLAAPSGSPSTSLLDAATRNLLKGLN